MTRAQEKVTAVLITADGIMAPCLRSIIAEKADHPGMELVVNHRRPGFYSENAIVQKYENCHRNRNEARERALRTAADYFLFMDDDIVLPRHAIRTLLRQQKAVVGGYYRMLRTPRWVCGRWVADNTFRNFLAVQPGLARTDTVGLGCALISREVVEQVPFEAGVDLMCKDALTGQDMIVGECGVFGNRVFELGIPMYMCGEVVCEHLAREPAGSGAPAAQGLAPSTTPIHFPDGRMEHTFLEQGTRGARPSEGTSPLRVSPEAKVLGEKLSSTQPSV